jgi:mRNA-degrading endonuclease RelE of RelBE toxin-antitoxin system
MTAFRIADTFTDSLAKLTGDEQKAVKTTAFDLQLNPANPGMQLHKLDKAKDKNFWSVRVNKDIRLIVHKMSGSLMLCYVDHHDKAYAWAERRKLEVHPTTGAAQLVEIRERIEEIAIPMYVAKEAAIIPKPPLFAATSEQTLLDFGVPTEWLADVRGATEDTLLEITDRLPQEAAEALLDLATGTTPKAAPVAVPTADPFEHPDALRRFRVIADVEELTRALEYPWDRWTVFLHPAQRELVERQFGGPARVSGSAGTGKTVVALHRAVFLAKSDPDGRVLLTTFSDMLANALRIKLRRLISNAPRLGERIDVDSLDTVAVRLFERNIGRIHLAARNDVAAILREARGSVGLEKFTDAFLVSEWEQIVDAWRLFSWEEYRDVARLGRRLRLPEKQRMQLWAVFERAIQMLSDRKLMTMAEVYTRLASHFGQSPTKPFDYVVVDESQDLSVFQLRFLASLAGTKPNALFFAGDLGQRIFQSPFSWRQFGVDIRGRASTLRINYRTSHQIRRQADRLLDKQIADVDGNEERRDAVSVFNGPRPEIRVFSTAEDEIQSVGGWLSQVVEDGVSPSELGILVRSAAEVDRARDAMKAAGIPFRVLDERVETVSGSAAIGTMRLAKGLEFRAVAVMACDDEIVPLQSRIEAAADDAELEDTYKTERHLLYVACTRARDRLLVTAVNPGSEFLEDMLP